MRIQKHFLVYKKLTKKKEKLQRDLTKKKIKPNFKPIFDFHTPVYLFMFSNLGEDHQKTVSSAVYPR